ncbi:2-acylglycerol O-acyltransferase 3 [Sigmodon hispidus]
MEVSSSPLHRSLQVFAVLQWVFSFLGLALMCLMALVPASLGPAWTLVVLYLAWLYKDRHTPRMGGRRCAWVWNWAVWRYFRDYFPITLVKMAELDPSQNYLSGFHPHGVLVVGAFSNFCTEVTGFSRLFPGLKPRLLMLPCWFQVPLFRDYIMTCGLVSSYKASASYLLSHPEGAQVAVLAMGGPLDALEAKPGPVNLRLRNRKGFITSSLEHGASLVPVFSFGEKELFQQYPNSPGSWVRRVQETLQRMLSVALPLFHGRLRLLIPFRVPIHTVVGAPIPVQRSPKPSREQVDQLYIERLTRLFEEYKTLYRVPVHQHLVLILACSCPCVLAFLSDCRDGGPVLSVLVFLLLFTRLWFFSFLYFVWLYLDWNTPTQGGRPIRRIRKWTIWKLQRDYFPIKLLKTAELPADQNYVLGAHPHGITCSGTFCNFFSESNAFSQVFPGLRPLLATLSGLFYLPLFRDYIMSLGMCPVSRQSLDFILSQPQLGQAVVILVGGAHEALYSIPGEHYVILKARKGFVRLALRHGASLVPIYSFGENDIYRIKFFAENSWQYWCQVTIKRLVKFSPCIFWGRGLFSANTWGMVPFAKPITTVVGRPIPVPRCLNPTEDQVDHYHQLYMKALEQLFEDHKETCGIPASTHLTFL